MKILLGGLNGLEVSKAVNGEGIKLILGFSDGCGEPTAEGKPLILGVDEG